MKIGMIWKSADKIQVSLKYDKENSYLTWRPLYLLYGAEFFLRS